MEAKGSGQKRRHWGHVAVEQAVQCQDAPAGGPSSLWCRSAGAAAAGTAYRRCCLSCACMPRLPSTLLIWSCCTAARSAAWSPPGRQTEGLSHTGHPLTGRRGRRSAGCWAPPPARPCIGNRAVLQFESFPEAPNARPATARASRGWMGTGVHGPPCRAPAGKLERGGGVLGGLGIGLGLQGHACEPGGRHHRQWRRLLGEGQHRGCHRDRIATV